MMFIFFALVFGIYFGALFVALFFEYPFRTMVKVLICPQQKILRLKKDLAKQLKTTDHLFTNENESGEEEDA